MSTASPEFYSTVSDLQPQALWENFLDIVGDDLRVLLTIGTTVLIIVTYWTLAGIYSIIDMTNRPRWLLKYKIQSGENASIDKKKFWKAVRHVLFNQLVVTPVFIYLCSLIVANSWTKSTIRQLPSLKLFLIHLGMMALMEEPIFYYGHRLLHHPSIYKYIHKKHHEWTVPIAAITFYCHPLEQITSNVGPIALSAILLNAHITVVWAFSFLAIVISMADHAGYPFPVLKARIAFHDYHHELKGCSYNFGAYGWLDKLHGTFREKPKEVPEQTLKKE